MTQVTAAVLFFVFRVEHDPSPFLLPYGRNGI
jgi:hypothetical protein